MPERCEVAIIGGGILGVGAAQACAAAGYDCVVVEKTGWASGTSSRSSKLIHGGLRYLETGQYSLVHESLRERAILLQIAPELVFPLPFLIPVYDTTSRPPWKLAAGLGLYSMLAGWTPLARFNRFDPGELPAPLQACGLRSEGLEAVFRYWDARTDDAALTHAVLASAVSLGARALCPAELQSARADGDGYRLQLAGGTGRELRCDYLVNAAGPWINEVLARVSPPPTPRPMERVLGSHLELEPALHDEAFYLESPIDRRAVFVLPWRGRTLLGTTERRFDGDPSEAAVSAEEHDYLMATLQHHFPAYAPTVVGRFAGVRVLPGGDGRAFVRPRDCVFHWDPAHPRLLSLYGGKLTGYRSTGLDVVAKLRQRLGHREPRANTATLPLSPTGTGRIAS